MLHEALSGQPLRSLKQHQHCDLLGGEAIQEDRPAISLQSWCERLMKHVALRDVEGDGGYFYPCKV